MAIPNRRFVPSPHPRLDYLYTDDGSISLYDRELDETYHSGCGAVAETWKVYVLHGCEPTKNASTLRILEYGFGTGLGYLLTAAYARAHAMNLEFISLERWLLPEPVLQGLELCDSIRKGMGERWWNEFGSHCEMALTHLMQWRRTLDEIPVDGDYRFDDNGVQLRWIVGDARGFEGLDSIDCVYFDAFSPKTNPDLWSQEVLEKSHRMLKVGGRLCSYCVSSNVRKMLQSIGFTVERLPGPVGGKREVLRATRAELAL